MKHEDIIKMAKEYADEVTNGHGIVTYEFDAYGLEKFALLIVAAERERIIAANAPEIEKVNVYIKALEDAVAAKRARLEEPDLAQVGEVGVWGKA